jgi:beta-glucanase (GH16 family)
MKSRFLFLTSFCLLLSSCSGTKSQQPLPCDSTKPYKLSWQEEFNYTGLPDSTVWNYEVGYVRNHEKQYYTRARPENVRVENGNLVIESRYEKWEGFDYTSGSINTLGKIDFPVNTRIEVRAKLPSGKGIWPAIWSMGTDIPQVGWPSCGEVDIMEFVGHTPGVVWGTFHWQNARKEKYDHRMSGDSIRFADLHGNYHIYGVERTANSLSFFVDNTYYFTFTPDSSVKKDLFTHPFYLLLNTAIGGDWGGAVDSSIFPQKFCIDWVRAFEIPQANQ